MNLKSSSSNATIDSKFHWMLGVNKIMEKWSVANTHEVGNWQPISFILNTKHKLSSNFDDEKPKIELLWILENFEYSF